MPSKPSPRARPVSSSIAGEMVLAHAHQSIADVLTLLNAGELDVGRLSRPMQRLLALCDGVQSRLLVELGNESGSGGDDEAKQEVALVDEDDDSRPPARAAKSKKTRRPTRASPRRPPAAPQDHDAAEAEAPHETGVFVTTRSHSARGAKRICGGPPPAEKRRCERKPRAERSRSRAPKSPAGAARAPLCDAASANMIDDGDAPKVCAGDALKAEDVSEDVLLGSLSLTAPCGAKAPPAPAQKHKPAAAAAVVEVEEFSVVSEMQSERGDDVCALDDQLPPLEAPFAALGRLAVLPPEIALAIVSRLSGAEMGRFECTCRAARGSPGIVELAITTIKRRQYGVSRLPLLARETWPRVVQRWEWTRSSRSISTRMDGVAAALDSLALDKRMGRI